MVMSDFLSIYVYLALVVIVVLSILGASSLFPSKKDTPVKFMPYESGIQTQTHLLQERFPLHHYLVGLMFLVFDIEIIFLFPWAVVAKEIGPFAFYEVLFFLIVSAIGFIYVWRKGGLQWE
jgi:NADH-quinone oxidoreductase subunit A